MNKTRMTIRFDREEQADRGISRKMSGYSPGDQPDEPYSRDNPGNASFTRQGSRLATERRRLEQEQEELPYEAETDWIDLSDGTAFEPIPNHETGLLDDPAEWKYGEREEEAQEFGVHHSYDLNSPGSYYRPRNPASVWKVAASIAGAVLTGLLFGTVVLSMFTSDSGLPSTSSDTVQQNLTDHSAAQGEQAKDSGSAPPTAVSAEMPEQTFYLLQYGMFSTPERAKQAENELAAAGIAAYHETLPENRVYAGISPNREQAKLLSSQLKNEGVELYVREVVFPGAVTVPTLGEAAVLQAFYETGGELAAELSQLSAALLGSTAAEAAGSERMNMVTTLHLQWTEALRQASAYLGPEAGGLLHVMEQNMNTAVTALAEYNKNRAEGHLWEIQSGMLNYIMKQRELLQAAGG